MARQIFWEMYDPTKIERDKLVREVYAKIAQLISVILKHICMYLACREKVRRNAVFAKNYTHAKIGVQFISILYVKFRMNNINWCHATFYL